MNEEQLLNVLLAPHVSEKAVALKGQHVFKVFLKATKGQVKKAVERYFDVKIKTVRLCRVKGKTVRFQRIRGKRRDWKKAYITLRSGYEIDIASNE